MNPVSMSDQEIALHELFTRVARIAESMNGAVSFGKAARAVPGIMTATPSKAPVPELHVTMPDNFIAEFAPPSPLYIGNTISVRIVRLHHGKRKNDWSFELGADGVWQYAGTPLSDGKIRVCLTPEGPPSLW